MRSWCQRHLNGRYFLNVSTGGIGAETTTETSDEVKAALGPLAYAVTGVRKLTELEPMRILVSHSESKIECDALLFAVGNGRATGGSNLLTPHASLTDGLLDVCMVEAMPVTSLLPLLLKLRSGEHPSEDGEIYFKAEQVTIVSSRDISVNVDGEPMRKSRLDYRAHASDLRVYIRELPTA